MAVKWQLKEVLKTFVMAPGAAALTYIITAIMYALAVSANALPANQPYAAIIAAVVFAIVVVMGIDDMLQ